MMVGKMREEKIDTNKVIIEINDISPYRKYEEYNVELIESNDSIVIKNILKLIEFHGDSDSSPQSLFNYKGRDYISYFIIFENLDGIKIINDEIKEEVLSTVKELLGKEKLAIAFEDIIEIQISFPEKNK